LGLNLFQKYCPITLNEVVGHDIVKNELYKRIRENNFPHCIYITGQTGVGKTVLSRIIAKSILCEDKDKDNNFCNNCSTCKSINNETQILNYFEINASNCGIDDMRDIEEQASRKIGFTKSSYKVFYIDELQEMITKNKIAVKNLLKLLEKQSKYSYFILGSMDDSSIPKSIKNRCVTYNLHSISNDQVFERLYYICEHENITISNKDSDKIDVLNCIVENSSGSLRTAISLLERCIYSNLWTEDKVILELNLFSDYKIIDLVNDLLLGDTKNLNYKIYNNEIINKVKSKLILLYKAVNNYFINNTEKELLKKLVKVDESKIEYTIETLNELLKFNYISSPLIEFYLLKIIFNNKNKKQLREKRI